jgi:hypothetical protein
MNVALENTEEWAGGRLTGRFGDCFLRGNNGKSEDEHSLSGFYHEMANYVNSAVHIGARGYMIDHIDEARVEGSAS